MTREEALNGMNAVKYGMSFDLDGNKGFTGHEKFINKIYDDFEKQFKKEQDAHIEDMDAKNSVIMGLRRQLKELKEALSCKGCICDCMQKNASPISECHYCSRYHSDRYVRAENV